MSDPGDNLSEYEIALEQTPAPPEPESYDDGDRAAREAIVRYHQFLVTLGNAEQIGRFVLATAHAMSLVTAGEMAEKMGVSKRQAFRACH